MGSWQSHLDTAHLPATPTKTGRKTDLGEHVFDVYLSLIGYQLLIVSVHPTKGEGQGIRHAVLFHLFFHALQNIFDGHTVKHPYKRLVDHHFQGHLVSCCGCCTHPIDFVLLGHEGKLGTVDLDVEFYLGAGGTFWLIWVKLQGMGQALNS